MAQHDQTSYPLKESHRAVPCIACHTRTVAADGLISYQFSFKSTRCLVCHKDPHHGEVKKYVDDKGCEFCHNEASWSKVSFDHGATKFPLDGKHASVTCIKCHHTGQSATADSKVTFAGAAQACQDCHKDIHRGQFAAAEKAVTECAKCHTPKNWVPAEKFDHNTVSRFKLDGAHKGVACVKCHRPTVVDGLNFVAYKPLDTACAACHDASMLNGKGKKS
jgi:hypothetical protein